MEAEEKQVQDDESLETATADERRNMPVTESSIRSAWDQFAQTQLKSGNNSVHTALKMPISISDTTITVSLANAIQEDFLLTIQPELVRHLRDSLSNDFIEVITQLDEINSPKKAYTDQEKLAEMIKLNPAFKDLKDALGLDPA